MNKGVRFFCGKISGNSCIIYTLVAKALKDNLILFFDIRMYVAFRSVEKIRIVLLKKNNNNTDDNDGSDNNI